MKSQNRTALYLVGVVATMASLSFAAVPFYDWFCRVTGFGGTTMRITREGNASPCWLKAGSPTEAAAPPAASILSALRRVCRVMVVSWL